MKSHANEPESFENPPPGGGDRFGPAEGRPPRRGRPPALPGSPPPADGKPAAPPPEADALSVAVERLGARMSLELDLVLGELAEALRQHAAALHVHAAALRRRLDATTEADTTR
jgi:hypothetical protein